MEDAGVNPRDVDFYFHGQASPLNCSNYLTPNIQIGNCFGMKGKASIHHSEACCTGYYALEQAVNAVASGKYNCVLSGCVEFGDSAAVPNHPYKREKITMEKFLQTTAWLYDRNYTRSLMAGQELIYDDAAEYYKRTNGLTDEQMDDTLCWMSINNRKNSSKCELAIERKTYDEIAKENGYNSAIEYMKSPFNPRTGDFLRMSGIEIKCDRSLGYYIANSEDLEGDGIRQWLLESLSMSNLLKESADMRDRILFERIPSSRRWLPVIVNAMRDGKAVEITYQGYSRKEPSTFTVHPYCLKLFKQCWYMLGESEDYDMPRIYALDERMKNAVQTKKKLTVPARFNAEAFFSNYFGIIVEDGRKPSTVELKVDEDQIGYFESLPLHPSQVPVKMTKDYTIYQYHLVPTFDFRQEVLRHGPSVEVLAPEWFRDEVAEDVRNMMKRYD